MPIKSEVKQESDATIKKVEEDRGLTIQVSFLVGILAEQYFSDF